MTNHYHSSARRVLLLLAALILALPVLAQDEPPAAEIINDEGGPVIVQGQMNYTNLLLTAGVAQPIVLLEDQAGYVDRDFGFIFPPESQVLGNFTSDFYVPPVDYSISLPIEPRGTLVDVDNDDTEDTGVMIYTPAYWNNIFGDPFLEARDAGGGGWSTAYAGTDTNAESEVRSGDYLVYAPEEGQGFPSGFGEDGLLFTEDDPIVTIPQGWTIVNMNQETFTFDRSRIANIDLLEPQSLELNDFTDMSYTEAFEATIDLLRREYSFTEYKNVDWDALAEEYALRIEEAEANNDAFAYKLAMRDFSYEIPDGHVNLFGAGAAELQSLFLEAISGGLGMNIMELDDGRVIVSFVLPDGPAASARIQEGDEIVGINGVSIQDALEETMIFGGYSTPYFTRLQQLRYIMRSPVGTQVDVTYRNSGTGELDTVTLTSVNETETFSRTSVQAGAPAFVGPVEFDILESGYGYVQINSFFENEVLTIQDWEYFLTAVKDANIPGIVIDVRYNGGGSPVLANQMAGYFYDEETVVGFRASYNDDTGEFFVREEAPTIVYPAPEPFRYDGEVVVMVGPACASACETFSYAMSLLDNVEIVGQYPSQGLGGGVQDFLLPEGLRFRYTVNRGLNGNQEIHIEGIGVVPTVPVPITEETVFSDEDVVLQAAVAQLDGELTTPFTEGAALSIEDEVSGTLTAGERVRHPIVGPAESVDLIVDVDTDETVVLRIYSEDGELLAEAPQSELLGLPLLASVAGETLIIEISTAGDAVTADYTVSTTPSE